MEFKNPTEQDFLDNKTFCVVHVTADANEFKAHVLSSKARITKEKSGEYRINPYGLIGHIQLGEFCMMSAGTYSTTGVIIGYSEDKDSLLEAAKSFLETRRQQYLERLKEHIAKFEALEVSVKNID